MTSPIEHGALLVTGGSGFLGGRVVGQLQSRPWRGPMWLASHRTAPPPGFDSLSLDLAQSVPVLPPGLDTVLHIAGEKRDETRMDAVNHLGTRRLAEAAASTGVRRFVYVSSVGSYGALPYTGPIDESFPHLPRNRYEASKDAGEVAVREVGACSGMCVVVLQPANVIGLAADGSSLPLLGLMRMIAKGLLVWFGSAEPQVNYVSVDDVASAALASLGAPAGTYIINTPARLADVVGWVCEELHCPAPRYRLPLVVGQAAAAVGGALQRWTGRGMPLQRERLIELTNTNRYDPLLFMTTVDFAYPVGVEKLIRSLARTYREMGLL